MPIQEKQLIVLSLITVFLTVLVLSTEAGLEPQESVPRYYAPRADANILPASPEKRISPTKKNTNPAEVTTNPSVSIVYNPPITTVVNPSTTSIVNSPAITIVNPSVAEATNFPSATIATPPTITGLGRHFIDPDFGTQMIQVTNQNDGTRCVNAYSYWPSFNLDSTKIFIACDENPILYHFDPVNFSITKKEPLFRNPPPSVNLNWQDALWSDKSPNILFARLGISIWSYNTDDATYLPLKDFSKELPGSYITQLSKSVDDNRFAFTIKDPKDGYNTVGYAVWDRREDKIIYNARTSDVDEVQLDKSGQYLTVKTTKQAEGDIRMKIVELSTSKVTSLTSGAPDFAVGHSDNGRGTILGYDNWNNTFVLTSLADASNKKVILNMKKDWQASHVSLLGNDEGWALISFYAGILGPNPIYKDQIILAATDGSGRTKSLASHNTTYREYWDSPRASLSRDGKFALFTSNWGDPKRRDVYIIRIP
ncbi:MAG: hypothetical protein WD991_01520 [Candidatus Paceibacterota bacterium]